MPLSNDERGWVMTSLSGIACVLGASIICVDIIVRLFPGKKHFRIQDSDAFLSASLSLSFGVMLFSALYSMLPSSKKSLISGGFSPKQAAWTLIGCFLAGVAGISVLSRIIHQFMPSHIVDCEHSHEAEAAKEENGHANGDVHDHDHADHHDHTHEHSRPSMTPRRSRKSSLPGHLHRLDSQYKPARRTSNYFGVVPSDSYAPTAESEGQTPSMPQRPSAQPRRPSMQQRVTSTISQFASGKKDNCDTNGPCHGYSEPCGQECFKNVSARSGFRTQSRFGDIRSMRPPMMKSATASSALPTTEVTPLLSNIQEEHRASVQHTLAPIQSQDSPAEAPTQLSPSDSAPTTTTTDGPTSPSPPSLHKTLSNSSSEPEHHHHHVPTNAFLSIGLQTSIAIALHKLPEGFITYATNHANPTLGVSVFLALFIHNITEGFAMALPLYLAINSRWKAMVISFVLGGLSQPIGAGVAAVWFKLAGNSKWAPSEGVYGCMFAVTAGIMASVALQLFSESLDLTHSKVLCMVGAFTGMGVLGISSALTA